MRPRYVQQRDNFRCGPVAILNALKWSGCRVTSKLIPSLCKAVSCIDGTYQSNLGRELVKRGKGNFFTREDKQPTLKNIEKNLRNGGAVLLSYWYRKKKPPSKCGELEGHNTLIVGVSKSGLTFYVANYFAPDNTQRKRVSRSILRNDLKMKRRGGELGSDHAQAWYLRKR